MITILVVEDDRSSLKFLGAMLEKDGYTTKLAGSGEAGH